MLTNQDFLPLSDNIFFLLISSVIFITAGNFIGDYKKLIVLKIIIIFSISFKINFFEETKRVIKKNKVTRKQELVYKNMND